MTFESDNEQILEKVIDIIHQIEPDVKIQNMMTQTTDEKKYSQCYHEHDHCNCNHDHHEHDHCDCGHAHEAIPERDIKDGVRFSIQ